MTIRKRLTLWYAVIMFVSLLAMGGLGWLAACGGPPEVLQVTYEGPAPMEPPARPPAPTAATLETPGLQVTAVPAVPVALRVQARSSSSSVTRAATAPAATAATAEPWAHPVPAARVQPATHW